MKPGAILINTSRGPLVDTAALRAAIAEKKIRVGMDVFEGEPTGGEAEFADKELAAMVTCTPHIGASTDQAADAIAAETVRIVKVFLETGRPAGTVNLATESKATHRLVVKCTEPGRRVGRHSRRAPRRRRERREHREHGLRRRQSRQFSLLLDKCPGSEFVHALGGKKRHPERVGERLQVDGVTATHRQNEK